MKILVTGATGHIGYTLVPRLIEAGHAVRALVFPGDDCGRLDDLDVEQVAGDVRDKESLRPAFEGRELVVHLAAVISMDSGREALMQAVNVEGVRNVAEVALEAGVGRMVHVSSVHAYDTWRLGAPLTEDGDKALGADQGAYDRSKALGELALQSVIARGLEATILNPVGVLGPYDHRPSLNGAGLLHMLRGPVPVVPAGGFPFVDVRDVCDAIIAAFEKGAVGENHLLSGEFLDTSTVRATMYEIVGRRMIGIRAPIPLMRLLLPFRGVLRRFSTSAETFTADALRTIDTRLEVDASKARRVLGFEPRSVVASMRDAAAWWRAEGYFT